MTISPSASLRLITWETNQEVKRETTSDTRQGSSSVWVSGDSRGSRIASFISSSILDLPSSILNPHLQALTLSRERPQVNDALRALMTYGIWHMTYVINACSHNLGLSKARGRSNK